MANILLTWELGGGLGHLVNLLPLAKHLRQQGHRVAAALRDLSRVYEFFQGLDVTCLQAPIKTRVDDNRFDPPRTFSHILYNTGFGDYEELSWMTAAWRHLYDLVQPDLIVFDHSPMALLAARGCKAKRALIGTGFFCPTDSYPLPNLRPWLQDQDPAQLCRDEDHVLSNVNRLLRSWGSGL
jgi:UDP:flavonoid glycosyltransferase YjiC (YdhE family)